MQSTPRLIPQDFPNALPKLPEDMREQFVAAYVAYCIAVKDSVFNVKPDESTKAAVERMMYDAVEGANYDAVDVKGGSRTLIMELDGDKVHNERLATLQVLDPKSNREIDIALALMESYAKVSGQRPKTVREALTPVFN